MSLIIVSSPTSKDVFLIQHRFFSWRGFMFYTSLHQSNKNLCRTKCCCKACQSRGHVDLKHLYNENTSNDISLLHVGFFFNVHLSVKQRTVCQMLFLHWTKTAVKFKVVILHCMLVCHWKPPEQMGGGRSGSSSPALLLHQEELNCEGFHCVATSRSRDVLYGDLCARGFPSPSSQQFVQLSAVPHTEQWAIRSCMMPQRKIKTCTVPPNTASFCWTLI